MRTRYLPGLLLLLLAPSSCGQAAAPPRAQSATASDIPTKATGNVPEKPLPVARPTDLLALPSPPAPPAGDLPTPLQPTTAAAHRGNCAAPGLPDAAGWETTFIPIPAHLSAGDTIPMTDHTRPIGRAVMHGQQTPSDQTDEPLSASFQIGASAPITLTLSDLERWNDLAVVKWSDEEYAILVVIDRGNTAWWRTLRLMEPASETTLTMELAFDKDTAGSLNGEVEYTADDRLDEPTFARERAFLEWIMCDYADAMTWLSRSPRTPDKRNSFQFRPGQTFIALSGEPVVRFPFREGGRRAGWIEFRGSGGSDAGCSFPGLGRGGDITIIRSDRSPVVINQAWHDGCLFGDMRRSVPDGVDEDVSFVVEEHGGFVACLLNPRETVIVCTRLNSERAQFEYLPAERATTEHAERLEAERAWLSPLFPRP